MIVLAEVKSFRVYRLLHFKNSWLIERLSLVLLRVKITPTLEPLKKISERLIALEKVKKPLKMTDLIVYSPSKKKTFSERKYCFN